MWESFRRFSDRRFCVADDLERVAGGDPGSPSGGSLELNTGGASNGTGGCTGADCGAAGDPGEAADVCGDALLGKSEECDDGNATPGDGCSGVCLIDPGYDCLTVGHACTVSANEVCGDSKKGMLEACDDGNAQNNDGCSSTCEIETGYSCDPSSGVCTPSEAPAVCGNGLVESQENCDDANTQAKDGCSDTCQTESGFDCVSGGEPCEPAAYCGDKVWVCGNGKVDPHEACDDGNTAALDGCTPSCTVEPNYTCPKDPVTSAGGKCTPAAMSVCPNAIVENDETCDDGDSTPNDGCTACHIDPGFSCPSAGMLCTQNERCGDGNVDLDLKEQCDDGNITPGDGCGAQCTIEPNFTCPTAGQLCKTTIVCGDGTIAGTEQCDDGNKLSTDALAPYCGDGVKTGTEACDDGAKNVALATAYGKTVCTSVCSKAPYCGDGHVQSNFEDCDGSLNCERDLYRDHGALSL